MRTLLILISLAGCGRIGFGETRTPDTGLDGAILDDATTVIPDGLDPDALVGCGQPAPFLQLIDVIIPGNNAVHTVRYCYASLPGPLNASIREQDNTLFTESNGPIEPAMIDMQVGSLNCFQCFVRLEANGIVFVSVLMDFIGD